MHRSKKKRNLIIFSLVGILICMVAGYAAFSTQLEIKGTSKVTSNWDIRITNVTDGTPTGTGENTVAPSWTNLTANMEADLYGKGDAMEYDVTIENKGTIDAKLDDITTNIQNANSDAVTITFSGYTKGEKLLKGESKIIHVKIEYNPNYTGGETSSEVKIDFNYTQNNNSSDAPDTYLLTYDYQTNGGTKSDSMGEYLVSGAEVNLQNTAIKEDYTFIGWNTDKNAQIGMQSYQMPNSNTTLYAIYSKNVKITYQKDEGIESISKETDTCTLYNNDISCEITLPSITASSGYEVDGWYNNDTKVGIANDKYQVKEDTTLIAKALEPEPIIQNFGYGTTTDFHNDTYKSKIVTATFLDNKDVPENAVASWDVSDKKNKSVMAWVIANADDNTKYDLYIGGNGGVIANADSSNLFRNFSALKSINFGNNFDTSNVTNMLGMFCECSSLVSLDLIGFNTSNVTNMLLMFSGCSNIITLDLSSFDTSKVSTMSRMFYNCSSLATLDLSNFNTSNVTTMTEMFSNCKKLVSLDVSNFDTSKVTDMRYMFRECNALTSLDVSGFNTSNVTTMYAMFYGCNSLPSLDVTKFNTGKVTNMRAMFGNCASLSSLDVSNFNTSNVTNMSLMFNNCSSLTNLDLSNFNTSNVTTMTEMFYNCKKLVSIDVSNFDTGKVTDMSSMFRECNALTSLDVSGFNTSNVTNMFAMFYGCHSLSSIDVTNFNTSNVTNMRSMFGSCASLTSLNVTGFDTSKVTTMFYMFGGCSSLTTLDLSSFVTSNVTDMGEMFKESGGLTKLNLCSFDTSKVTSMSRMLYETSKVTAVYVGPLWTMESVTETDDMFLNSGVSEVTQSNNCEVDAEDIGLEVSTTSATNSITVVASAQADSGIVKYEYSKDGGTTYETGMSNTYTFTGLNAGTNYDIRVRVTSKIGKILEKQTTMTTSTLEKPTFTESGSNQKTVTINYPEGCGSTLTCTYQKDNETVKNVTGESINIEFSSSGSLAATVTDGTNTISSSYTITVGKTSEDLKALAVTTEDGLYADEYETGKYTYIGAEPNNYITFNNEVWRIISIDSDNTIKIIRNESIGLNYWNGGSGGYDLWSTPTVLNTYLNSDYLTTIEVNADKIVNHDFNVGNIATVSTDIEALLTSEKEEVWNDGKIGLINISEFYRAGGADGWLGKTLSSSSAAWTITHGSGSRRTVYCIGHGSSISYPNGSVGPVEYDVYPVLHLSSDLKLSGTGSSSDPYKITN